MSVTAADVCNVAKSQIGYQEGYSNGHWNNIEKYAPAVPGLEWAQGQAWCATFVSWCAMTAGAADLYPRTASCATGVSWFKQKSRFSYYPAVGAQVFYGSGGGEHTGICVAFDADTITCVEGNTNTNGSAEGDGVYLKIRQRRDDFVYGYGYPSFADGSVSADPKAATFGYTVASTGTVTAPAPAPSKTTTKPASKPVVSVAHINAARAKDIPAATGHTTYPAEVKVVEAALKAEGFLSAAYASDGSWGTMTDKAFTRFRREVLHLTGDDATGAVGIYSLTKLASRHGFTAKA
ncbi:CHAP domain-containing protein [Streptomyces griseofuscus]|uniref:CHAP domain-containing protein n=1 Tax=Streptomyces griseofuscus TaxID=146922 RepID=UPI0033FBD293